jgi:hypothetical protein
MGLRVQDWVLLAAAAVALLVWYVRKGRRIRGRAPQKENSRAVQLLEEAGYQVLAHKPSVEVRMEIDGGNSRFELKSDYLVARDGRRYLVCLHRDGKPLRLQSKAWRNALLRDVLAFRVAGIVVVNTDRETVQQVSFRV